MERLCPNNNSSEPTSILCFFLFVRKHFARGCSLW